MWERRSARTRAFWARRVSFRASNRDTAIMLKILTIDDSRVMRQMLEATLSGAGHTAIQAVDGQEGLEKLDTAGHVDLIITDINMPRLDGFGFIEKARQHAA